MLANQSVLRARGRSRRRWKPSPYLFSKLCVPCPCPPLSLPSTHFFNDTNILSSFYTLRRDGSLESLLFSCSSNSSSLSCLRSYVFSLLDPLWSEKWNFIGFIWIPWDEKCSCEGWLRKRKRYIRTQRALYRPSSTYRAYPTWQAECWLCVVPSIYFSFHY